MRGGDISNKSEPRLVFVWDDLLFHIEDKDRKREMKYRRHKNWNKAVELWEEDPLMGTLLTDILWRRAMPVDILCFHEPPFVLRLRKRLESEEYPFNKLYSDDTPLMFTDKMVRMPWIGNVFYPKKLGPFLFGNKGVPVENAQDIQRVLPSKWT